MVNKTLGRPTVLTTEVVSILISSFQNGMTVREACWQSGISHEAYYSRLRDDGQFADTMAKAQASSTLAARQVVINAINGGDVNTAKWWLERKLPEEFGRNTKPESEPIGQRHGTQFKDMSDEELDDFGKKLYSTLLSSRHTTTQ